MRIQLTTEQHQRFEAKVDRSGGPDACHLWTACDDGYGYGAFNVGGRIEKAHRIAWCLAGNEITPEKPCVLHNCPGGDNPACCNPRHLWVGTRTENQRDMATKGRGQRSRSGLPFGAKEVKGSRRFAAQARIGGRNTYLGLHDTPEEASIVALRAKARHYGLPLTDLLAVEEST